MFTCEFYGLLPLNINMFLVLFFLRMCLNYSLYRPEHKHLKTNKNNKLYLLRCYLLIFQYNIVLQKTQWQHQITKQTKP